MPMTGPSPAEIPLLHSDYKPWNGLVAVYPVMHAILKVRSLLGTSVFLLLGSTRRDSSFYI